MGRGGNWAPPNKTELEQEMSVLWPRFNKMPPSLRDQVHQSISLLPTNWGSLQEFTIALCQMWWPTANCAFDDWLAKDQKAFSKILQELKGKKGLGVAINAVDQYMVHGNAFIAAATGVFERAPPDFVLQLGQDLSLRGRIRQVDDTQDRSPRSPRLDVLSMRTPSISPDRQVVLEMPGKSHIMRGRDVRHTMAFYNGMQKCGMAMSVLQVNRENLRHHGIAVPSTLMTPYGSLELFQPAVPGVQPAVPAAFRFNPAAEPFTPMMNR